MQEEITQETVSFCVETGKMTADLLQQALKKVLEEMKKQPSQRALPSGSAWRRRGRSALGPSSRTEPSRKSPRSMTCEPE